MNQQIDLETFEQVTIKTGISYRNAELSVSASGDGKKYEFVCSSEAPVECRWMYDGGADRYFYGTEILLHGVENVDMSWISSGNAPFLKDHEIDDQVGVIVGAELKNRTLIVTDLKFSRSQDGVDNQNDIDDGIRKNVSIGYVIEQVVEVQAPHGTTPGVYHVTRWKPYEVSSVSIPAVDSVGFGRSDKNFETVMFRRKGELNKNEGARVMEPVNETGGNQVPAIVVTETASHASEIASQAEAVRHLCPKAGELAARAIAEGINPREFYEKHLAPAIVVEQERQATVQIGMTAKDKQRFSLIKLVRYMSEDKSIRKEDVLFELETTEAYCKARGISSQRGGIIVPHEAIPMGKRAAITSATTGAGVVEEIHSGEVIDYLRAQAVLAKAGARFIGGLVGKYDMARIGVGTTAYWVGEKSEADADVTTSALDLDLLQFTLKTVAVNQGITRQMMRQTSLDVEGIVRGDIYASLADAIDLAGLAGTGANSQPTGVMYTANVGTETLAVANNPNFSDVVNMETTVAEAKALRGELTYVVHPTLIGLLKQTLKAAGVPGYIAENNQINGYNYLSSTNAIKGAVKSIIFGNWQELMIGMWGGIELVVDPFSYSRKGIVSLTAFQDVDVQLRHPASFVYSVNP